MTQGGNREKWKEQDAVWSCSHKCFVFAVGGRSEQDCTATVLCVHSVLVRDDKQSSRAEDCEIIKILTW